MSETTLKGISVTSTVSNDRQCENGSCSAVRRTHRKKTDFCNFCKEKKKGKRKKLHERKIMLTFFPLFFKPHAFSFLFLIPRLFGYICTKCVRSQGNGDNDGSEGVSVSGRVRFLFIVERAWSHLGPFSHFGHRGCQRLYQEENAVKWERKSCAATRFTTLRWPEHAHTAVLNCTDNRLLHILSFPSATARLPTHSAASG